MHIVVKTHRSEKNVLNDEKRCVARVDEVPGLDQACTRRKKEVWGLGGWGGGGGVMAACVIIQLSLRFTFVRMTF